MAWNKSLLRTGEHPHSVCVFLDFFFGIRDDDWCQEEVGMGRTLHTKVDILGVKSDRLGSKTNVSADSIRRALNLISLIVFGVRPESFTDSALVSPVSLSQAI